MKISNNFSALNIGGKQYRVKLNAFEMKIFSEYQSSLIPSKNKLYQVKLSVPEMVLFSKFQKEFSKDNKIYQVKLSEPEMRMYAEFQKEFARVKTIWRNGHVVGPNGKSVESSIRSATNRQNDIAQKELAAQQKQADREAAKQAKFNQLTPEKQKKIQEYMNSPEAIAKRKQRDLERRTGGIDFIQENAEHAGQYRSKETVSDMSYAHASNVKKEIENGTFGTKYKDNPINTVNKSYNPNPTPPTNPTTSSTSSEDKPGFFGKHWKGIAAGTAGLGAGYLMFNNGDKDDQ